MNQKLSVQHLVTCLTQKQKYKGTSMYIHEVGQFNENMYSICSQALTAVLLDKESKNYMSKLMALRFWKELFMTGNITLIDQLNQDIQDEIFQIALYNRNTKEKNKVNRGANYFVQMNKLEKNIDVQKVGVSYVILACQIFAVFGRWYAKDQKDEQTRFSECYQKLKKKGVPFSNNYNFFKKEEEQKFRKNYAKWLKWYVEKVKEEQLEETAKNITEKNTSVAPVQKGDLELAKIIKKDIDDSERAKKQEQKKEDPKIEVKVKGGQKQEVKKGSEPIKIKETVEKMVATEDKTKVVPKQEKQKLDQKQPKVQSMPKEVNSQDKKYQQKIQSLLILVDKGDQQRKILQQKYENEAKETKIFKDKIAQIQKIQAVKNFSLAQLQKQKQNIEKELISKCALVSEINTKNKQLEEQNKSLCNKIYEKVNQPQKKHFLSLHSLCSQTKILPHKVAEPKPSQQISKSKPSEQLQQKVQVLMQALESTEMHFKQKRKSYEEELQRLREQNKEINQKLQQKEHELQTLKKSRNIQEQYLQSIVKQDSLVIEDQPNVQFTSSKNTLTAKKINENHDRESFKNSSIAQYFMTSQQNTRQNVSSVHVSRSKSLKKTESQHRLSSHKMHQTFSNTGFGFDGKVTMSKLNKTSGNFKRQSLDLSSKFVTFYPYLENYFPPLPKQICQFKELCLISSQSKYKFFENNLIKASISKLSPSNFAIYILNKTRQEYKIKLLSSHYSFSVQGDKTQKLCSVGSAQFIIVTQNIDLNLRYPVFSVMVQKCRVSRARQQPHDVNIHMPLPITLWDFCKVHKQQQNLRSLTDKIAKYSSNAVILNKSYQSVENCLPLFDISYQKDLIIAKAVVSLIDQPETKTLIEVEQIRSQVKVNVCFDCESANGSNLGKVLLQTLLYLMQE